MTSIAAYLLLFVIVGIGFIFVHLLAGKLIRPSKPDAEKKTIYECGEPTVGSAWIQFDLRFYVVALLFVIFDVEVAFFFPWAEVFGKANTIVAMDMPAKADQKQWEEYHQTVNQLVPARPGANRGQTAEPMSEGRFDENRERAATLAWLAFWEIVTFFGVLLVGFAYLWKRGDLAWVRSTLAERPAPPTGAPTVKPAVPAGRQLAQVGH
jgi:NADH-quinone oxidoreductase subunit A